MSLVPVRSFLGLGPLPRHRASAVAWLTRAGIPISKVPSSGGMCDAVHLSDLPEPLRLAYQTRQAEQIGLDAGVQDDEAHLALMAKPMGVQTEANKRAAMLVFVTKHRRAGLKWPQIAPLFAGAGFGKGPSQQTVERWFKRVENVDPINWAPALAPDWKPRSPDAPMSEEAFAWFKDIVGLSGKNGSLYPLKWAYRDTAEQARKEGWLWPSYETVRRRFLALPAAERRTLMQGERAAASSLSFAPSSLPALPHRLSTRCSPKSEPTSRPPATSHGPPSTVGGTATASAPTRLNRQISDDPRRSRYLSNLLTLYRQTY